MSQITQTPEALSPTDLAQRDEQMLGFDIDTPPIGPYDLFQIEEKKRVAHFRCKAILQQREKGWLTSQQCKLCASHLMGMADTPHERAIIKVWLAPYMN